MSTDTICSINTDTTPLEFSKLELMVKTKSMTLSHVAPSVHEGNI